MAKRRPNGERMPMGREDIQIRAAPAAAEPLRRSFERPPVPEPPLFFEMLELGMEVVSQKTVSEKDINTFAEISGDKNPVHVDAAYAAETPFKGRIAHGMLTAGIAEVVMMKHFPGPGAKLVSMTLNFRGPVRISDTVATKVRLLELFPATNRAQFEYDCTVGGKTVLEGVAVFEVPSKSETGKTVLR